MILRPAAALLAAALVLASCGSANPESETVSPDVPALPESGLAFDVNRDDFTYSGEPDPRLWAVYDAPGTNSYGYNHPENVTSTGQALMITGRGDEVGGLCYCGTEVPEYAFGDFEFRVRVDKAIGYSMVIGMWPDSERWPIDGEIDMVETPRNYRGIANATLHWGKDNSQYGEEVQKDFSDWVTVNLEWRTDRLVIRYDGDVVLQTTDREQIPQTPMHAFIQLDSQNGDFVPNRDETTPDVVKAYVDYVKFTPAN